MKFNDYEEKLNKVNYSIRSSQAVYQYGPGGMVDFKDQTLMTAAPDFWPEESLKRIDDERLAKALHVNGFRMPGAVKNSTIPYVRFPAWYFCPACRRLKPITEWQKEYSLNAAEKTRENDPYMLKHMVCPKDYQPLIVSRVVTVCEKGHIDDFPWIEWVHSQNFTGPKPVCSKPELKFYTVGNGNSGPGTMRIECSCGAKSSLRNAFNKDAFEQISREDGYDFRCTGHQPWKHIRRKGTEYPRAMMRGGSAVYYPYTVNSLLIPPYSDHMYTVLDSSYTYQKMVAEINSKLIDIENEQMKAAKRTEIIEKELPVIASEIGYDVNDIRKIVQRKFTILDENIAADSIKYKAAEYLALTGETAVLSYKNSYFQREETDISEYGLPFVKQIALITKVKEVRAQVGFTRIKPVERTDDGSHQVHIVHTKNSKNSWYPAYEVYGEGIFIEFDQSAIDNWIEKNPTVKKRAEKIDANYKKSFGADINRTITPRFVLLHTMSHLLIKQLSYQCGYNIASLSERLYCSETIENMAGIFIYTADGDSEGTLGGLVRQGRKDIFPQIFRTAIENAVYCSNDPVCSLSEGQGRDSLNLAACYSCTLIPETSCEEFNGLLDRGMIVGTYDNREIGIYYDYLFNNKPWENTKDQHGSSKQVSVTSHQSPNSLIITGGTDQSTYTHKTIWNDLAKWADDDDEKELYISIANDQRFEGLEKPFQGCTIQLNKSDREQYQCSLVWKNAKICFFTLDEDDDYDAVKDHGYSCFYYSDENLVDNLLKALKGGS